MSQVFLVKEDLLLKIFKLKNYKLEVLTKIDSLKLKEIENFVDAHPHGNFFQSVNYFEICLLSNKNKPYYFIISEGNKIVGVLLVCNQTHSNLPCLNKLSKRNIISGGPLILDDDSAVLEFLLDNYVKLKPWAIYTQIRNFDDCSKLHDVFNNYKFKYKEHLNFKVDTKNKEDLLKKISKSKKRQINQSLNNGAEIRIASSISEIKDFYLLLEKLYKSKIKMPLPDFSFFQLFFEKGNCNFFLIYFQNKVIGGILSPMYKNTIYEYYVCGLDNEFKGVFPSVLATWAPIDFAFKHKLEVFDFMGAGKPEENYGVREFKAKFGGDLVNYGRFEYPHFPLLFRLLSKIFKFFQKIK